LCNVHLLLEEFKNFSHVIVKYTIIMSHNKSYSRSRSPTKKQGLRIPGLHKCASGCTQVWETVQHRTVLMIFLLIDSRWD